MEARLEQARRAAAPAMLEKIRQELTEASAAKADAEDRVQDLLGQLISLRERGYITQRELDAVGNAAFFQGTLPPRFDGRYRRRD